MSNDDINTSINDDGVTELEDVNKSENFSILLKRFFSSLKGSDEKGKKSPFLPLVITAVILLLIVYIIADFSAGGLLYTANGKVVAAVYGGNAEKFSVSTDAEVVHDFFAYGNGFAMLTENGMVYVNSSGDITDTQQITYSSPALDVADDRILIYDRGNDVYSLHINEQLAGQPVAEGKIIDCAVSKRNNYAVAVRDSNSKTALYGYDASGTVIYQWNCPSGYIFDVSINSAGGKAVASVINSKNAVLNSTVYILDFEYTTEYAVFEFSDETVLGTKFITDRKIQVVTDKKIYLIRNDEIAVVSEFGSSDVVFADIDQSFSAVITRDYSHDDTYNLYIIGSGGKVKHTVILSGKVRGLSVSKKGIAVLFTNKTETYSKGGKLVGSSSNTSFYDDIVLNGNYIYVLSADSVKKIPAYGRITEEIAVEDVTQ